MGEINLDRKVAIFGIKFALIALSINMIAFIVPVILDLMQQSTLKIYAMYGIIIYGILAALAFMYFAIRIKIPKS